MSSVQYHLVLTIVNYVGEKYILSRHMRTAEIYYM